MTTQYESGCSAYHIGQQEAAQDEYWRQVNIEAAAEDYLAGVGCISDIAEENGVTVKEIINFLN